MFSSGIEIDPPAVLSKLCLSSFDLSLEDTWGVGMQVIEVADCLRCLWTVEGCSSRQTDFDF